MSDIPEPAAKDADEMLERYLDAPRSGDVLFELVGREDYQAWRRVEDERDTARNIISLVKARLGQ